MFFNEGPPHDIILFCFFFYRFFTIKDGVKLATPLFLCLVCVELSDVVFAFDSVPAVRNYTILTLIMIIYDDYSSPFFSCHK